MKVYTGKVMRADASQVQAVMAANNMGEVAEATGETLYRIQGWWSVTGNPTAISQAMAHPGKLMIEWPAYSNKYQEAVFVGRGRVQ